MAKTVKSFNKKLDIFGTVDFIKETAGLKAKGPTEEQLRAKASQEDDVMAQKSELATRKSAIRKSAGGRSSLLTGSASSTPRSSSLG